MQRATNSISSWRTGYAFADSALLYRHGDGPSPRRNDFGPPGDLVLLPAQPLDSAGGSLYPSLARAMDIFVSLLMLLLSAPVILLSAMAIKLTSRGPIFFHQPRAGKDGIPFIMFKLRTMYDGADDDKELFRSLNSLPTGPCFKIRNDPRVTRVGRWLRRSSIDELPQLFNVLRGDMSLVGPRPLPLDEAATHTFEQRLRLSIKPGITCLWQVSGRTEIPYAEWLALDLFYIRNRSILLDVQILLRTIPAVLSARGAY